MAQLNSRSKRYTLVEQIGMGGMGIVYEATDHLAKQSVALKRITLSTDDLHFTRVGHHENTDLRVQFTQEFKMLASLRHPHIISVLDYGFDRDQHPYFTMELLRGGIPFLEALEDQTLEGQIDLLAQLLLALSYLHQRNIVHRDLKPNNILVYNGQVKLLDFGLATNFGKSNDIVGTLHYLAPEVVLGAEVRAPADLYAIGIMLYELVAGQHPFAHHQTMAQVIQAIVGEEPNFDVVEDSPYAYIIEKLLVKDPNETYQTAQELIQALYALIQKEPPAETAVIRESVLNNAQFVGRDDILRDLRDGLSQLADHKGSGWLVGGVSGTGKSRLLDELRVYGLVQGIPVLKGQAIREGGNVYQIWRDVLREMMLLDDVQALLTPDLAAVIKQMIPDLPELLNKSIPDAPILDGQQTQKRLVEAIIKLLKGIQEPLMIILEDIHWTHDARVFLHSITKECADLPLFVIASYRTDEKPYLASELPYMRDIRLSPLAVTDVMALAKSIMGEKPYLDTLVNLLHRETNGNALFIIEILRALAEESGTVRQIGEQAIPTEIAEGGLNAVIKRRISHLPADMQTFLRVAAVSGRNLEVKLLNALFDNKRVLTWIQQGFEADILEVTGQQWRFTHNRIRETLLSNLTEVERTALHHQIALTSENLFEHDGERISFLAYHFYSAQLWAQALEYASIAAEQATALFANNTAVRYYEWAVLSSQKLPDTAENRLRRLDLLLEYDEIGFSILPSEKRLELLSQSESLAQSMGNMDGLRHLALVYMQMSRLYNSIGDMPRAIQCVYSGFAMVQSVGDEALLSVPSAALGILLCQQGKFNDAHHYLSQAVDPLFKARNWKYWALANIYLVVVQSAMGFIAEADAQSKLLTEHPIIQENATANAQASISIGLGYILQGRWQEAIACLDNSFQMTLRSGDVMVKALALYFLGYATLRSGDLRRSQTLYEEANIIASELRGQMLFGHWITLMDIYYEVEKGESDHTSARLDELLKQAQANDSPFVLGNLYRVQARRYLKETPPNTAQAIASLEKAVAYLQTAGAVLDLQTTQNLLSEIKS